ncbi:MAG: hypothetical protein SFW67_10800 [Myxococcaceae bacterium]|nr:hypothetical protein [Myxococcaceae bacterium]
MTLTARALVALSLTALFTGCPEDPPPVTPPPVPLAPLTPLPPVATPPLAQLTEVEGTVALERDGGTTAARPGPLFDGDLLATGPASRALLLDEAGRALELQEETRFRVGSKLASLELLAGSVAFSAGDGGSSWRGVTVKTASGTATLGEGAVGRVQVADGGFAGTLAFGEIEFEFPDAGTTTVKQGTFSFGAADFEMPAEPTPAGTVKVVVEVGKLSVKRPGEKTFTVAKSGEALAAGTAYQVGPKAAARLEGPGATVALAAGATGITEGVREESGVPVLALTKVVGPLTVQLDGKGRGGVKVGEVAVGGTQEATVLVTQAGKKQRVEVKSGEVAVTVDGKPTMVKAGEGLLIEGTRATALELKPGLVVNGASRVKVHADGVSNVAIVLPDETNRVEVARDEAFASTFIAGPVGRQVLVPGAARGQLFFRTTDASGATLKQGRLDFLPDVASARDTATRSDVVAETGQKATVYYQSKVPALTFAFNAFEGAKAWRFQLYAAGNTGQALIDRQVPEGRLVLEPGVLSEGDFIWSATPLDANGVAKAGVRLNKLEVLYDNARTTLLIERPLPGERAGPDTKAVGVAPGRSQVFVNGKLVKTDERGRFSVPVAGDAALFRVVLGESESYWLRRLRR